MNNEPNLRPLMPLSLSGLICLFGRPKDFFSGAFDLKQPHSLVVVGLFGGLVRASSSLSLESLSPQQLQDLFPDATPQWGHVWKGILATGLFLGLLKWLVGGFWYHLRATWCGYQDNNRFLARAIFIYTEFIVALPMTLYLCAQTIMYSNPLVASINESKSGYLMVASILSFLSIFASYVAVVRLLGISGTRTKIWFLILPLSTHAIPLLTLMN